MELENRIKDTIRDVHDFPKEGIIFKDISTILLDAQLSKGVLEALYQKYKDQNIDGIAGIESRGFLFGFPLAMKLGVPFIMIRKQGKLPYKKISHEYQLEYGHATIEMHTDVITEGQRILIHDDLLATGGSAQAAAELVTRSGGVVAGFDFLVELEFLNGQSKLKSYSDNIRNLVRY